MRVINECFVIPSVTDEEVQRTTIRERSGVQQTKGILHFHSRRDGCVAARKPCEKYDKGIIVEEF